MCLNDVSSAGVPFGAARGGYVAGAVAEVPGHAALVFVVSADAAVRRALALLLETEGIGSRSFASAPVFLAELPSIMEELAGAHHCLLVEDCLADGGNGLELAERVTATGFPMPAVVLKMPVGLAAACRAALSRGSIIFADPFQADAVLQHVRGALCLPDAAIPA
ncbi:hypothetical protein [Roseomonas xinghualingensis]|uniref:hypothetical protein n=1 Tax=Roseomonas xinghualingensis TaxID=2986475 RepID=UPI0021F13D48|nr:hypothetical protein [Roseomonas sp. SXEYE001]MCV4209626.1 hypothetical protein [Roseomonas sp. SXEYE001]